MKKLLSLLLAVIMLFNLCVPAFAAGVGDQVLRHSLDVGGEHEITVATGDIITVNYVITNTSETDTAPTYTTQNQIVYDYEFFDLVEGSIKANDGTGKDSAGLDIQTIDGATIKDVDISGDVSKGLHIDSDEDQTHYVFLNSAYVEIYAEEPMLIGTFKLRVIAEEGTSVVENTTFFATKQGTTDKFGEAKQDLTVTIGGGVEKITPTVDTVPTATVTFGDTVDSSDIIGGVMKDNTTVVPGTWEWKSDVTSYGNSTYRTIDESTGKWTDWDPTQTRQLTAVFTPEDTTAYKSVECPVNVIVAQKAAPTLTDINISTRYSITGQQQFSIVSDMPEDAAGGYTWGVHYDNNGEAVTTGSVQVDGEWGIGPTGNLLITLTGGQAEDTVELPIKVSSVNYAETTVKIIITLTDKDTVELSGAEIENKTYDGNPITVKTYPVGEIEDEEKIGNDAANWTVTYYKKTGETTWSTALASAPADAGSYKAVFDVPATNPNYKAAEPQTVNFTIVKGKVDNTVLAKLGACNEDYDGNAHYAVTGINDPALSGYTLTYSTTSADDGFGTTMPQLTTVADSKSVWVKVSDANHESVVKLEAKVNRADQNPSITPTQTLYVGGTEYNLIQLVSGAIGEVTFEMADSDAATLSEKKLTPIKAGEVKITVKAAGNDNYNAYTGTDAITVTVSDKPDANVTITGASDKTYGGNNFTLTASAENKEQTGGTWKWTVDNSGTFEIVGSDSGSSATFKILKANTTGAKITATYEDATYIGSTDATIKVDKATLTPSIGSVADKTYDGATTGSGTITLTGEVNGENPAATGTFTWTAKDAGTNKVNITNITLTGDWGDNYKLSTDSLSDQDAGKSIDPKTLTKDDLEYTGSDLTKKYDRTTDCDLTSVSVKSGVLASGDTLPIAGTAVYNDKDVADATKVTFTPTAITEGNYRLAEDQTLDIPASITEKTITITGVKATNRDYNGEIGVELNFVEAELEDVIPGDTVGFDTTSATGKMDDADVGTNKAVTVTGIALTGDDKGNYTLTQPTGIKVTINKLSATVNAEPETGLKYDGTGKTGYKDLSWDGLLSGDSLTVNDMNVTYYLEDGTTKTNNANSGATTEGGKPVNAGSYKVKLEIKSGKNYTGSKEVLFSIDKAPAEAPEKGEGYSLDKDLYITFDEGLYAVEDKDGNPVNTGDQLDEGKTYFIYKIENNNYIESGTTEFVAHVHNLERQDGKPATEKEDGYKEYYYCEGCNTYFEDASGTVEIPDLATWKAKGGNGYIPMLKRGGETRVIGSNSKYPPETEVTGEENPNTGAPVETAPSVVLATVLAAGICFVCHKNKETE